jgi:predicted ATPase
MLNQLTLENFKSWRSVDAMRLAPITGLFGANSSGKTSILQALLMMRQTVESSDRKQVLNLGDENSPVNLGTFKEVLHRGRGPFRFGIDWTLPEALEISNPEGTGTLLRGDRIGFETRISAAANGRMRVDGLEYDFAGTAFRLQSTEKVTGYALTSEGGRFTPKRARGRQWELPEPVKSYGFPDQVRAYYQNVGFLADLELAFEEQFRQVAYLGPLREYPKRQYTWAGSSPEDMGQRGERVVDALLASRDHGKISRGKGRKSLTLEEYVAYWLQTLGLVHDFEVEAITRDSNLYRVWIQKSPGAPRALITDVGFGVSQILPVIALCYYVPRGSTVLLEQPEIHLHPAVQSGLADVFIDAVKVRGIQIILESHSEHLLRRLQRRLAEEALGQDQVALYFADATEGLSRLRRLELDNEGNIRNWPSNFFGDELGDLAAMTEAAMRRRIAAAKAEAA